MTRVLVNLTQLDPTLNGGLAEVARCITRRIAERSARGELEAALVVGQAFASEFGGWLDTSGAQVINVATGDDARRFADEFQPTVIVSPLFGPEPLAT